MKTLSQASSYLFLVFIYYTNMVISGGPIKAKFDVNINNKRHGDAMEKGYHKWHLARRMSCHFVVKSLYRFMGLVFSLQQKFQCHLKQINIFN